MKSMEKTKGKGGRIYWGFTALTNKCVRNNTTHSTQSSHIYYCLLLDSPAGLFSFPFAATFNASCYICMCIHNYTVAYIAIMFTELLQIKQSTL